MRERDFLSRITDEQIVRDDSFSAEQMASMSVWNRVDNAFGWAALLGSAVSGIAEVHVWPGRFRGFDSLALHAALSVAAIRRAWLKRLLVRA